jgi:ribosomal protein S21
MLEVRVPYSNDKDEYAKNFDKSVKIFKKIVSNDGFIEEIKDRRYYKKPSEKRRDDYNKKQRLFKQLKEKYNREY